ncbi:MAG: deoxyribonuclease V [bacterium]|jgi:deoxyribonuclease V
MILAVDVDYRENFAVIAGVLFQNWSDAKPEQELVAKITDVKEYIPGEFYQRELPCILELLKQLPSLPTHIIVDGYVHLGEEQKNGLGGYLYEALEEKIVVIGVAKSFFRGTSEESKLCRGESKKPLFITSKGISLDEVKQNIAQMDGKYRFPTLLKHVDQICRTYQPEQD